MSDGYIISVGVKADFSELKAEQRAAQDAVKQATENMKAAYAEFGQAAERGSVQAIEALKVYETELAQAQARSTTAGAAMAQAQASVGAAVGHTVPQMAAASSAIRELEGNFSHNIRAAERFLTTTLGLGPALQAAFPVIGALALGGVIFEIAKGLAKFGEDADELSRELGVGWLDGAIAQMTGLGDVVKDTDKELEHLAKDLDSIRGKQDQNEVQFARLSGGPGAGQEEEAAQLQKRIAALQALAKVQKDAVDQYQRQANLPVNSAEFGREGEMGQLKAKENLKVAQAQYNDTVATEAELRTKIFNLIVEAGKAQDSAAAKSEKQSESAAEKAKRTHGEVVVEMQKINEIIAKEDQRVTDEVQAQGIRALTQDVEFAKKTAEEKQRAEKETAAAYREGLRAREDAADESASAADVEISNAAKLAEAQIQYELVTGQITAEGAAHALAAVHAKEYADKIAVLRKQLEELAEIQKAGGDTGRKSSQIKNQISSLEGSAAAGSVADQGKEARGFQKAWDAALTHVGRQFSRVEDEILRGQVSVSTGAKRMAAGVALDAIHWGQEMLFRHFGDNARKLASTNATNAATLASDGAAAQASTAITRTHALQQAFIHAKLAAVKAFDWGSSWGGPIVGAIMAAGAFTGAMAWAAFEQGGVAQVTGPAYLHAGERVMTARQTAKFDSVMSSAMTTNNSSTNSASVNYAPTFHGAGNDKEIKRVIKTSSRDVVAAVKRGIRNGHF